MSRPIIHRYFANKTSTLENAAGKRSLKGDPFKIPPLKRRAPGQIPTLIAPIISTDHPIRYNCDPTFKSKSNVDRPSAWLPLEAERPPSGPLGHRARRFTAQFWPRLYPTELFTYYDHLCHYVPLIFPRGLYNSRPAGWRLQRINPRCP